MFAGPEIDDPEILRRVPAVLGDFLSRMNGYVAYHGGLHVRGACHEPAWHSLRNAWEGDEALHHLFDVVLPGDVPFAEDCMETSFCCAMAGCTGWPPKRGNWSRWRWTWRRGMRPIAPIRTSSCRWNR